MRARLRVALISMVFQLIEQPVGLRRAWWSENIHRPLLEAIVDVPHLVAILPHEIAQDADDAESIADRLEAALIVEVEDHSPQVQRVLDERTD